MLPTSIWLGLTVTARPGRRRIAGVYGFTPDMSPAVRRAYRRQLNRAHAVVCNAPHLAAEATREFGVVSERVHVVPNGVHLPEVVANVSSDPPRAVVVANFHPYKGYADLLRALALLPTDSKLSVHLCGGGHERVAMQQLSTELGLCSQVVFVEPPVDVRRELSLAQFAIHPSHTEGLSNSILEQLAFGLPVIACDVGGNSTLIKHGENGLLVPAADPDALAGAITLLAARPSLRIMMSASARLTAERFGWKACTDAHIDLYISLIRARRR
uniref:Unannotated protein n=1 Tax=freshwater metagenome TaxID=449393 RepID=A0A6J7M3H7_9ZZZZ